MKKISITGIVLCITMLPFLSFGQQSSSGIIDYSIVMQRKPPHRSSANQQNDPPRKFTMQRQLTFNIPSGKFASLKSEGKAHNRGRSGSEFINFKNETFIRAFKKRGNDTTFYTTRPFKTANDFTLTGKHKKILGYNCQEATARLRKEKVSFWFTKDLPVTFSPINGIIPPKGGLILDLNSDRMQFHATKIQLKKIDPSSVSIPSPSHELSRKELEKVWHSMHNRKH